MPEHAGWRLLRHTTWVVLAGALVAGCGEEVQPAPLTVRFGGGADTEQADPGCSYLPAQRAAQAKIRIRGDAGDGTTVTITVSAYADENTSDLVGSTTRVVRVRGTDHDELLVTIPVTRRPHRGEDGGTACKVEFTTS